MYLQHKEVSLCLAAAVICFNIATINADYSAEAAYVIKSTSGDLYVDATNTTAIQIQNFDGTPSQLWRIDCGHTPGLFRFFNYEYTAFLSIPQFTSTRPRPLVLDNVTQEYWQEWFLNGNGRITNAAILHNLEVTSGIFEPGNGVGVHPDTGNVNQEWEIVQIIRDKSFK